LLSHEFRGPFSIVLLAASPADDRDNRGNDDLDGDAILLTGPHRLPRALELPCGLTESATDLPLLLLPSEGLIPELIFRASRQEILQ
jgi:hypothetical protein